MGDPRRIRKKYRGPGHPWQMERLEQEHKLKQEHGLKNKREIYKSVSKLQQYKAQAKRLIRDKPKGIPQTAKEEEQMLTRLYKIGLLDKGAQLEDVLPIEIGQLLDRRLQSVVVKHKMALTAKQARQFIVHGHVLVNGKKIDAPGYIVSIEEEEALSFNPVSSIADEGHPERVKEKKERKAREKAEDEEKQELKKLEEIEQTVVAEVEE